MPYSLPADMARQLLYLAGDKVDYGLAKQKLLEGGWMPRGGSGRSARGEVVPHEKFTDRRIDREFVRTFGRPPTASNEQSLTDFGRTFGRPSDQQRYEDAVAAQRLRNMPEFNPQMTNPYPSKPMAQSYQERQPIPIRPQPQNRFDEAYARMGPQERALVDRALGRPGAEPGPMSLGAVQQSIRPRSADTAQTSFPSKLTPQDMALKIKMQEALYGRQLTPHEEATLFRPGWESPQ